MSAVAFAAVLCAGLMGLAIQRGGTCTVAAVDEVLTQRRAHRLAAMLEASLWVAGALALAQHAQLMGSMPAGYPAGAWAAAGGALLGLGAWLNRACVFGAIARLGSGEWAYAATPLGFYAGCLSVQPLFARPAAAGLPASGGVPGSLGFVAAFAGFVAWRALRAWRRPGGGAVLRAPAWSPHAATVVIGLSFVATLLLAGRWAYTDVLADLAGAMHRPPAALAVPLLLLAALYVGALAGGRSAGRWRPGPVAPAALLRCFAGGAVMGWGSLLIPGSNDGLVLVGLPLLQPHAWLAFAAMVASIAAAMGLQRALAAGAAGARRPSS